MSAVSNASRGRAAASGRRIPAAVFEADRVVRERVSAAEARARDVLAQAEAEAERVREQAREAGRREGLAEAAATLAAAAAARDRLLRAVEAEVVTLALDVARKVLGRHLAVSPGAVAELAARALTEARDRREVTVRVHPDDAPALRAGEGELAAVLRRAPLALREDAAIPRGGVVVETEAGRIDAGVEAQLAHFERALAEALA